MFFSVLSYGVTHEANVNINHLLWTHRNHNDIIFSCLGSPVFPLMAAVQVDSMTRKLEVEDRARVEPGDPGLMFRFKGNVLIPSLGLMDDNLTISEAGYKAEVVNSFMNENSA